MPRVALSLDQKKDYKLKDFKGWVVKQMKLNGKTQAEVGEVLGVTPGRVSQMLKIPKNDKEKREKRINEDPFSLGQILILFELFDTSDEEKIRLLTL